MITALDHIAIAVPDLEAAVSRFLGDFGRHYAGKEVVEAEKPRRPFLVCRRRTSSSLRH